jgi:hypothetical protein
MKSLVQHAVAAFLPLALVGCVLENGPPRRLSPEPEPPPAQPSPDDPPAPSSPVSPAPLLVEIDTDQTMLVEPGEGVGVFIEYASGGHWALRWTCDTLVTGQDCDVNLSATAASGNVTDVDARGLAGGFVTTPTPSRVEARVRTGEEIHGIHFATSPGAVITVEATIGGLRDGSFFFFVQDGKVNGGYTGRLTNPLQVQGHTP